jgi:hypothetical protein
MLRNNKKFIYNREANIMNFNIESITWDDERRKNRAKLIAEEINKSIQIKF